MANLQALYKALEKADAAGKKEDARGIASIIKAETLNAKALELEPPAVEQPKPEEVGFLDRAGESLKQGFEAFGGASRGRELASLKEEGKLPQAAAKMEEIKTKAAEQRTPTLSPSDINRIVHEKGLWPAGKEVPSFIVEQVLKSGPEMAVPVLTGLLASAGTAAVTGPAAPVAAPVVGFLAGTAAYGYQQYGHFMERQALEKEAPEELNPTQAKTWAAITAPVGFFIDKVGLGVSKFGAKAVGETAVKELARRKAAGEIGAATVAKEVAKAGTKQAGVAAISEAPTEVLEQMAERYQADLPLWNEEAKEEYYDAAWSAAAAGIGLGGVSGSYSQYRNYKKAQEEIKPVDEVEQVKPGKEKLGRAETIKALAKELEAKGTKLAEERAAKEEAKAKAADEAEAAKLAEQGVPPEQAAQAVVTEQAPPAEVEPAAPGVLNETTLTSLGLNKRSNAYKELLGVDLNTPQGLQFFEETLDSHTGRINEPAVAELVKSLTPMETENVVKQPTDRASTTVPGQQGLGNTGGAGESIGSAVDGATTDAGDVSTREVSKPASLENVQVGDEVAIGDKTYRKTDTGFELVQSAEPSEEAAVDTAPVKEEVVTAEEAPVVEEPTPIEKRGRALAKELRALDPEHPLVDDLTAFDVNEETLALAQQNIDELKAQRQQKAPTTEGELRELSEEQKAAESETPEGEARIKTQNEIDKDTSESLAGLSELLAQLRQERQRVQDKIDLLDGNMRSPRANIEAAKKPHLTKLEELDKNIGAVYQRIDEVRNTRSKDSDMAKDLLDGNYEAAIDRLIDKGLLTEKQAAFYYAIANGDVVTALEYITNFGANSWFKQIATQLDKAKVFPSISFGNLDENTLGIFNAENNQVVIDAGYYFQDAMAHGIGNLQEVLLHELMHAGTVNAVSKAFAVISNNAPAEKEYLDSKEFKAAKNLLDIFDYLKATYPDTFNTDKHYGATNPLEMISEAFANRAFQQELSTLALPDNLAKSAGPTNAWTAFVTAVKNILGLNTPNNALQRILENGANAVRTKSGRATPLESAGRELLYGKYKTSGTVIASKAKEKQYDEQLKRTGTKQNKPPKTAAPQVSANKAITDLTRKLRSGFFSFDLAINKKIMDAMRSAGVSAESLARAFYDLQVTQAVKADSLADSFLERGKISFDPNIFKFIVTEAAASMRNIRVTLDTLAKQKGLDAEKFRTYASAAFIAKRTKGLIKANTRLKQKALALYAQGKKSQAEKLLKKHYKLIHMSPSEIRAAEKFFTDFPELNGVFDMWNEVRENVLDFATEQGLYDEETRDDLLNIMDYVPFYRVEQLEAKAGPKEYSRGLLDTAADKAFKGSHQEVNDVFDNMERWARYMVMKSIKNAAAQNKIKYYAKYLPNDVKVIAKGDRSETGNTVSVWHNGKLKRYEFQGNDGETMVDGFTGLEPVIVNGSGLLLGALRKTAAFQRLNIVLNPIFSIAQIPQDMFSAMVSSGIKYPLALPLQVVKEIVLSPVGLSKSRKELKKTVTVGKHDYRNEFQRMDKTAEEEIKALKTFDKILKAAMSPFSALSMASDNVIRQAVYSQIMLETGDAARAAHSAEEIIHFRRTGSYGFVNLVRQYVPFVNANLQALHVTASTIVGDGINHATRGEAMQRFMVQGAQLIAATLLYTAMKGDDDEYKKLDPTERDRFLIINKDYKLPMRNDLFTWLFKIVPEHMFNRYIAESEDSTKLRKALKEGLLRALATPSALPTLATPFVEAKYNINTVTGRPLVGQGQEGLEAELQYSPKYTTELSKLIGEGTDISPTIIDNFLRDYFGATGMVLAMATNSLAAEKRGVVLPTKTDKEEYMQYPFFSSFLVKDYGSRNMADYYELNEVVNRVVQSYNKKNGFDYDMAQDYLNKDKNRDIVVMKKEMAQIGKQLANLRKYENQLLEDRKNKWTADEKAAQLKRIEEERQSMLGHQLELTDRTDRYIQQMRNRAGL